MAKDKATPEEMRAIVQRGKKQFAIIETAIAAAIAGYRELEKVYRDGYAAGMLTGHQTLMTEADFGMIGGKLHALQSETLALHARGTAVAKANSVDIDTPYAQLEGVITRLGGGSR